MKRIMPLYFMAAILLGLVFSSAAFAGGSKEEAVSSASKHAPDKIRIAALNGASGIPMAYLFENPPELSGAVSSFSVAASPDVLLPRLLKGEIDIGILPPNAAAKVYNKNGGALLAAAVVGNGMLSVITADPEVRSFADLAGKKITVAGQGATPDYMMRYLLAHAGIKAELDYSIPTAEIPAALAAGKISIAAVPEPFATVVCKKAPAVRRAIDVQAEYKAAGGGEYPMTLLVVRRQFAQSYPEIVRAFLAAYKTAVDWTNRHPEEAGVLVEKHTLGLQASIAAEAIPNAAFVFRSGRDMEKSIEDLLSIFLNFAPDSVGGALPDDGFYFY